MVLRPGKAMALGSSRRRFLRISRYQELTVFSFSHQRRGTTLGERIFAYSSSTADIFFGRGKISNRGLRERWLAQKKLTVGDSMDLACLRRLLLEVEHTWGSDTKTWLDFDHYTPNDLASV